MPNDLMQYLRMANIFGQNAGGSPQVPQVQTPQAPQMQQMFAPPSMQGTTTVRGTVPSPTQPTSNVADMMGELYTPSNAAETKYNELLAAYPKAEDYHPSQLRRIGGALAAVAASFGGPGGFRFNPAAVEMGQNIVMNPYNRQLDDWKAQITPAQKSAELERLNNVNERTMAYQTVQQTLKDQSDRDKARVADEKNALTRMKQSQPNLKFDFSGPTVMVADPTTGVLRDTGVKTGNLSDAEKLALQQTNAMAQIDARNQGQLAVAESNQTAREGVVEDQGWKIENIPDPNDPTKIIAAWVNPRTRQIQPVTMNGQNVGGVTGKISGKLKQPANIKDIQQRATDTITAINEIFDTKTGKLKPEAKFSVGGTEIMGRFAPPGTKTRSVNRKIRRIKSLLTLQIIGEMKAQSATGATGFGQMNIKELGVLEDAASNLDPTMEEADFEAEVVRILEKLNKVAQPADGETPTTTVKPKTADDLIKQYGGGR